MKKLMFIVAGLSVQSVLANRESGGFAKASAIYISFESLKSANFGKLEIDSASYEKSMGYIAREKARGHVDQHSRSHDVFNNSKVVCVMFHEIEQQKPKSADFVKEVSKSILEDRQILKYSRTKVFAGADCMNFASAQEVDL